MFKDRVFRPHDGSKQIFDLAIGNNQFNIDILGFTDDNGGCSNSGSWKLPGKNGQTLPSQVITGIIFEKKNDNLQN